ncbi:hypothetical protein MJO29_010098 [Puccinia striiformis f. sp. tritici]|nr:hypothetical protein MJO29_010098 [Puccinia striiformis f. sp. tritici]
MIDHTQPSHGPSSTDNALSTSPDAPALARLLTSSSVSMINNAVAKIGLTDDATMAEFEKKTLRELRDLQSTHIIYRRLDLDIKIEAQNLYFDYVKKQHLLSLKHQRPFLALTKYLGQRRTRQKESTWHKFMKHDTSAQAALHNTENNIGQRNIETAKLYNQLDPSLRDEHSNTEGITLEATSGDPNAEERGRFGKIFKSDEKLRDEVKLWAGQVQLKLKELSDLYGVEGFLVLASQEHRKQFFFQGGSFFGDEYLRGLMGENDPIRKFAVSMAGTKKISKKRKRDEGSSSIDSVAARANASGTAPNKDDAVAQPSTKKSQYLAAAQANRDVCRGGLSLNHNYISEQLGRMFLQIQTNLSKSNRRGWPGTDTTTQLAVFNHKLVVQPNPVGLVAEHFVNIPVKKIPIEVTWLILRGLKNDWIQLVEQEVINIPVQENHVPTKKKTTNQPKKIRKNNTEEEEEDEEEAINQAIEDEGEEEDDE